MPQTDGQPTCHRDLSPTEVERTLQNHGGYLTDNGTERPQRHL